MVKLRFHPSNDRSWRDPHALAVRLLLAATLLAVSGPGTAGLAQQEQPEETPMPRMDDAARHGMPMGGESGDMQHMAGAMKDMADMCRMMMEREMEQRPYLIAAGAVLGALLVIALVLFIVLEVQWIRFFSAKIKTERQKLT